MITLIIMSIFMVILLVSLIWLITLPIGFFDDEKK